MPMTSLSPELIQHNLNCQIIGQNVIILDTVDSTNTYLKSLARQGTHEGTMVIAEEQTAGRGRLGRTWDSQKSKNLTFSLLLKPTVNHEHFGVISLLVGVAVARALHSTTSLPVECKWPNDVLISGKKVCGILCEMVSNANQSLSIIVGIGINVNQTEFPGEIRETASSLSLEAGMLFDRVNVLQKVLEEIEYWYIQFQENKSDEIIQEWKKHSTMIGSIISIRQNENIMTGIFTDVSNDGALMLECNGSMHRILAGDVSVVKSIKRYNTHS